VLYYYISPNGRAEGGGASEFTTRYRIGETTPVMGEQPLLAEHIGNIGAWVDSLHTQIMVQGKGIHEELEMFTQVSSEAYTKCRCSVSR